MTAKIVSINISEKRGIPKTHVEKAELIIDHGIKGDAHAGPGLRQISLLAKESIDKFNQNPSLKESCAKNGMFAENITTEGIELHRLPIGTRLKINNTLIEISKIGKECHQICEVGKRLGSCIMPKEGIFAKVIGEGEIKTGDQIILLS